MRRLLLMGRSKHGKTTSLYLYAKRQIEVTGKKILVINTDGGSDGFWEKTDIAKFIRVVYPDKFKAKLAIMKYLSSGLVPVSDSKVRQLDMDKYSDVFLDGLTSTSDLFMAHLASHEALVGMKHALAPAGVLVDGDEKFSVNSMSHYNLVHKELKKFIVNGFFQLPLNVVITSLIDEGEDLDNRDILGPATCGKAITAKVTSWFPNCFHQEKFRVKGKERFRIWFTAHEDKVNGLEYMTGLGVIPSVRRKLLQEFPKGWIPVTEDSGLAEFFELTEKGFETNGKEEE